MAIHCPECGEQILSKKAGFCPGCHRTLPDSMQLPDSAKELLKAEYERSRSALGGWNSGADGASVGWAIGGFDGGGDCGGGDCGGG